jgi:predicted nucleotidyltransferase
MTGLQNIERNRKRIISIAKRHGAVKLRAFGSVVRGEDGPESDLDFLVRMEPHHDLLDLIALSQELEELLHRKTDVVSDEALSPYIRERILLEAIPV